MIWRVKAGLTARIEIEQAKKGGPTPGGGSPLSYVQLSFAAFVSSSASKRASRCALSELIVVLKFLVTLRR